MGQQKAILEFSNPAKVQKLAERYLGKSVIIQLSTRHTKKYMVEGPDGKWVHFGQMGYEDFTKHMDEERRQQFLMRNRAWKALSKWSPGWLAYHLLW